jgi:transcription termination factor Rho
MSTDMAALDRSELDASPLADLHALANELGVDGYRLLDRDELIDAILGGASELEARDVSPLGEPAPGAATGRGASRGARRGRATGEPERERLEPPARRGRGDGRVGETAERRRERERERVSEPAARRERGIDGGRARAAATGRGAGEEVVEGVVELRSGGSALLLVHPPGVSADDLYISPAQVKRCELRDGDRVSGPARRPRRSERRGSLARIDTINGVPADVAVPEPGERPGARAGERAGARGASRRARGRASFEDGPPAFPSELLAFDSSDRTLQAIEALAPVGLGSRAVIAGASRSGKSDLLRLIVSALAPRSDLHCELVLVGVRPEEIPEWEAGPLRPSAALTFTASPDAQGQAVERAIGSAWERAAKGADAVVLIDTLDGLHPQAARKALSSARYVPEAGSLTVIGTAVRPYGGETTVIALDSALAGTPSAPALDVTATGTLRPELIVGEERARAIARARVRGVAPLRRLRLWRR